MSVAKRIMIQGTMSGVGKSLLCAGLCRIFHEDGFRVAPFKSQNMALNSFITKDGLEMGRAQAVQAFAARIEPDVRMNPILLKPSSDTGSQVILHGEVQGELSAAEYFRRKKEFVPEIRKAFDSLSEEFDIVVIEGAGSPAGISFLAGFPAVFAGRNHYRRSERSSLAGQSGQRRAHARQPAGYFQREIFVAGRGPLGTGRCGPDASASGMPAGQCPLCLPHCGSRSRRRPVGSSACVSAGTGGAHAAGSLAVRRAGQGRRQPA